MNKSAKVWQFVQLKNGSRETWIWRACVGGAVLEISPPHGSFGKVVADALAHGFQPRRQSWETRSGDWITQFTPGMAPVSLREPAAPPGAAAGKKAPRNRIPSSVLSSRRAKPLAAGGRKPAPSRKSYSRRP